MMCLKCIVVSIIGHLMANGRDVKTRYGEDWKSSVCGEKKKSLFTVKTSHVDTTEKQACDLFSFGKHSF